MKLYQVVAFDELLRRHRYYVKIPKEDDYHVGYFCDYDVIDPAPFLPFVETSGDVAVFRHVDRYPFSNSIKMYTVGYEYFDRRHVFKRCVHEEEQERVRRAFFEKRAVNQIVSYLIGHTVVVY